MKRDFDLRLSLSCEEVGECVHWRSDAKSELRKRHPLIACNGKPVLVRRVLYERAKGELKAGMYLVPRCGDRYCVNPEHQRAINEKQKSLIGAKAAANSPTRAGTTARSKRALGQTRITEAIAAEIRASDEMPTAIGKRLGCDPTQVIRIRRGVAWRDYTNPFIGLAA
jgi:hypothetical protein